ncbi:hypothetical protein DPMN_106382 [Dreissena polymorpha]|uniref:G-protein coupled receptors family 1 profile domain-containing protein n=2 Tax=Dreissena polymorpha TaxID=45954 RepID=A0A9D4K514_DREPO|nr:hypothetical protein DPMN_106382 [Dreissena polymorpha]
MPHGQVEYGCFILMSEESGILCTVLTYFIPLIVIVILTFQLILSKLQRSDVTNCSTNTNRNTCDNNLLAIAEVTSTTKTIPEHYSNTDNAHLATSNADSGSKRATAGNKPVDIVTVCSVNIVYATMWFPFQCVSIVYTLCDSSYCSLSPELTQVVTLLAAASAGVVPLIWLHDQKLKGNIKRICGKQTTTNLQDSVASGETYV